MVLSDPAIAGPTFTAPFVLAPTDLHFTLIASNPGGLSAPATVTITVIPAPVTNAGPNQTVASGALVTLAGSATGTAPITFAWTQAGTDAPNLVTLSDPTIARPDLHGTHRRGDDRAPLHPDRHERWWSQRRGHDGHRQPAGPGRGRCQRRTRTRPSPPGPA